MQKKTHLTVTILLLLAAFYESGLTQSQSEYALMRRPVLKNPLIWKLTRSVTNDYGDIDLFSSPRATAESYIMDPWGELYTAVSFHLDHAWNRMVYSECLDYWIRAYGSYGSAQCQFWWPKSVDVLAPFNDSMYSYYYYIYVADTYNDRIVRLQYDWQNQNIICNTPITGGGLDRPSDLDLNNNFDFWPHDNDYLWVINVVNGHASQIKRFTIDGVLRSTFGNYGCEGQVGYFCQLTAIVSGRSAFLAEPYDLYANTDHFFVADAGNNRIVWLIKCHGAENVAWMGQVSTSSSIVDLEVDNFGQLWALDQDNGMITKYTYDLYPLCTFGSSGSGENQFWQPISISNTGGYYGCGNVYVVEAWTDSSGGQYFAIGTDILNFNVSSTQDEHWHYIDYILIDPSDVSAKIYNAQGQLVKTLFDADQFSGPCDFIWDGSNNSGQQSATGNYRVTLVGTCSYWDIETQTPANVVTKEAWFHHVYNPGGCCIGIRGDVNMSGSINVADVAYLSAYLKQKPPGSPPPPCFEEGDVNGSGTINTADVTYLSAYLKQKPPGSPAPPACP
jgi:hypothetical protein